MKQVAAELIKVAKLLCGFGIVRNPENVKKAMRDAGFQLKDDGTVFFYGFTPIGYIDYTKSYKAGGDIDTAVRRDNHVKESLDEKTEKYDKMLDATVRFKREPSVEAWETELKPFISKRVRDADLKAVMTLLLGQLENVEGENIRAVDKDMKEIGERIGGLMEKWSKQRGGIEKRRRVIMAVRNMLKKYPEMLPEIAD